MTISWLCFQIGKVQLSRQELSTSHIGCPLLPFMLQEMAIITILFSCFDLNSLFIYLELLFTG
jgi:hypothetical protein